MDQASPGERSLEIYTDPFHPASFSHPEKVLHYLRREEGYERSRLAQVKQALSTLDSYTRYKPLRRNYPMMTTRSSDVNERWQLDLANVTPFGPEHNDGFKFLLLLIDVFSRHLYCVPLYDKSSKEVAAATELIFMTTGQIPKTITSDSGAEFRGRPFTDLCNKYKIKQYFSIPEVTHASIVERVILTLRRKIGKYLLHNKTRRFMDGLEGIIDSYNSSIHSTIGMAPNDAAGSLANRQQALFNLQQRLNNPRNGARFTLVKEGDEVQVPLLPLRRFRKSHDPTFSADSFPVHKRHMSDKQRPVARFVAEGRNILKKLYLYPNEISLKNAS